MSLNLSSDPSERNILKTTKCQTIFSTEQKIILRDAVFCSFFFAKSKGQIASGFYSFFLFNDQPIFSF